MPLPKTLLLINPWIHDFTAYDFWMKPLGLLYIAAALLSRTDCSIRFVDCLDRRHPGLSRPPKQLMDGRGPYPKQQIGKPELLSRIPRRFSRYGLPPELIREELKRIPVPAAVLITCTMTYWYPGVAEVMELVREVFGSVPVVLGGIYATLCPGHAAALGADAVVQGPGEEAVLSVLEEIVGPLGDRDPSHPVAEGKLSPSFDLIPSPETLPILTSRGCPFRCPYCAGPSLFPGYIQRDPDAVVDEIVYISRKLRAPHIAFYDDALLLDKEKHIFPILRKVAAMNLPVTFHTPNGLHVREVDQAAADLFRAANVRSLYLSQESFSSDVLDESPKVGEADLPRALDCLEKAGYPRSEVNVFLLAGLPGQDPEGIVGSIRRVKSLGARPRLSYFSPVPGTKTWARLVNEGRIGRDADPLLHNKLAFAYVWGGMDDRAFDRINKVLHGPPG